MKIDLQKPPTDLHADPLEKSAQDFYNLSLSSRGYQKHTTISCGPGACSAGGRI